MDDVTVIAVGGWLIVAILCGFLAPSKGRNSGAWFVAGLLFGIFALAALAFVEPMSPEDRD